LPSFAAILSGDHSATSGGIDHKSCIDDSNFRAAVYDQLSGRIFESPDELAEATREIASAIPWTTLERVFLEWEERL
jgi:hypothetical protein